MLGAASGEWIKYQRTATRWLLVLAPAGLAAASGWYLFASGGQPSWAALMRLTLELWTTIFIPAGAALFAGISAALEDEAGSWRTLRTRPVPAAKLYGAKLSILLVHTLLSALLLGIFTGAAGALAGLSGEPPWTALMGSSLLLWVCALPLLVFQLWIAEAWGLGATVAAGIPGMLLAALVGGSSLGGGLYGAWWAWPWAWPVRAVHPILGLLGPGAGEWTATASPGSIVLTILALSTLLAALLTVLSLVWFSRREVS